MVLFDVDLLSPCFYMESPLYDMYTQMAIILVILVHFESLFLIHYSTFALLNLKMSCVRVKKCKNNLVYGWIQETYNVFSLKCNIEANTVSWNNIVFIQLCYAGKKTILSIQFPPFNRALMRCSVHWAKKYKYFHTFENWCPNFNWVRCSNQSGFRN